MVEMDSTSALQYILKPPNRTHPYALVISRIRDYLAKPWDAWLQHVYRKADAIVDGLAKQGNMVDLGVTFFLHTISYTPEFLLLMLMGFPSQDGVILCVLGLRPI